MEPRELLKRYFGHSAFRPGQETLIDGLLSGRDVLRLNAGAADFALPALSDGWDILLIDDFQMIPAEDGGQALCELIRSGADRRFVLLSPWRAAGLSDRLPVQRNGKILPCAAQSNTIKPPVRLSNRRLFRRKWHVLLCLMPPSERGRAVLHRRHEQDGQTDINRAG